MPDTDKALAFKGMLRRTPSEPLVESRALTVPGMSFLRAHPGPGLQAVELAWHRGSHPYCEWSPPRWDPNKSDSNIID